MRFLRWLNIWSVDISLAAGLLSMVLARLWKIDMPATVPLLLTISVWLIYTFDHIKDAFETNAPGFSARRMMHRKHFRLLIIISINLLLAASVTVFFVPAAVIVNGTALAGLVGAYFLALHYLGKRFTLPKEMIIALLYTAGIILGPLSLGKPAGGYAVQIIQLFLLALNNLLLFSWFDREADVREGFMGMATRFSPERMRNLLILFASSEVILSMALAITGFYPLFEGIWTLMSLLMLAPLLAPVFWSQNYRFRIAGDLMFLLPSLLILFTDVL